MDELRIICLELRILCQEMQPVRIQALAHELLCSKRLRHWRQAVVEEAAPLNEPAPERLNALRCPLAPLVPL